MPEEHNPHLFAAKPSLLQSSSVQLHSSFLPQVNDHPTPGRFLIPGKELSHRERPHRLELQSNHIEQSRLVLHHKALLLRSDPIPQLLQSPPLKLDLIEGLAQLERRINGPLLCQDPPCKDRPLVHLVSLLFQRILLQSALCVGAQLPHCFLEDKFMVVVLKALVHLALALPKRGVPFQLSHAQLELPLVAHLLDLCCDW